jgi:hypothetical protein
MAPPRQFDFGANAQEVMADRKASPETTNPA